MKIGIFDSGLGGLIIARAIRRVMPEYDYVYLGDTKRVPYGNRSHEAVFEFTRQAVDYLFRKENCAIVVVACNTASARALRKLQKEYLPTLTPSLRPGSEHSPLAGGEANPSLAREGVGRVFQRKILGVLIPAAEEGAKFERIGILGTLGTVASGTFPREINKIRPRRLGKAKIFQNAAPLLVPLAEEGEISNAKPFLSKYLKPFSGKKIEALVLGCTHYPIFKKGIRKMLPRNVKIISQDEIIPKKLKNYFKRHTEIEKKLSKKRSAKILVTDMTDSVKKLTKKWFGSSTKPRLVNITN